MNLNLARLAKLTTIAAGALLAGPVAQAQTQYLLLNYSANSTTHEKSAEIIQYVKDKFGEANKTSDLKVGVAVIYYMENLNGQLNHLEKDLKLAQSLNVPILIQVDTENKLPESLLNWYDDTKPGYSANKTADVEWTGWDSTKAVKIGWRNWGEQVRTGPQPNLLSKNFQAWERDIYNEFAPRVANWYNGLPTEKKALFVGWKCGWETKLNSHYFYYADGNSYYGKLESGDPTTGKIIGPTQTLGYNAAKTAGFKTTGVLDLAGADYKIGMKIVGRHLAYLASLAWHNGIPRGKIFLHSSVEGTDRYNMEKYITPYGNPAPSCYPGISSAGALKNHANFIKAVQTAKALYGAAGYGYGEFNMDKAAKGNRTAWSEWLTNGLLSDPDCIFQNVYNSDTVKGVAAVEEAILDVMKKSSVTVTVSYRTNGPAKGTIPTNTSSRRGAAVAVSGPGTLQKSGSTFAGWNTAADGSGTKYSEGNQFTINANTTLYAQWTPQTTQEPDLVIYDDKLTTGWNISGYGSGTSNNSTATVHSGTTSMSFNFSTNGTARGPTRTLGVVTSAYNYLSFWIHGGKKGGQNVTLEALVSGTTAQKFCIPTLAANTWVNCVVPLDLLNAHNATNFSGVRFASEDLKTAEFFVDDMRLIATAPLKVTYNGNGYTGGTVPADGKSPYTAGAAATVLGKGNLTKTGNYTFAGWNTAANGSGTNYIAGNKFTINANTTLYAQWKDNSLVLYGDFLSPGWLINGNKGTVETNNISWVQRGSASMSFDFSTSGGAKGPYTSVSSNYIDTTPYKSLSFWIHGGAEGGQVLELQTLKAGNPVKKTILQPLTKDWNQVQYSLSELGIANMKDFNGFRFISSSAVKVFYVDEIKLLP